MKYFQNFDSEKSEKIQNHNLGIKEKKIQIREG